VVFEDLHWVDSETQALLDGLVEGLPTARLLLLVSYRPEYEHAWGRKSYYLQLRIDPLPPESADALLDALLGEDQALEAFKRALIERTEGNPFFLEESVRTLVETQVLVGERGAYRLMKPPDTWQIPATAQAMLAARIDRLPADDKRLLQAAAVVGKDVPFTLLEAIAEVSGDSLRSGLMRLQSAEFLYEINAFPDVEYTFKHALTHEVAYGTVLQERRRMLHARIAETIERVYPSRLTEHVERLAHHALRGEVWDRAASYLRQAGAKAFARSANQEAVAYFEQALTALTHLPETRETLDQGVDLRLALRNALWPLGRFESGFGHLRNAEHLAEKLGDRRRLGWIAAYSAEHTRMTGHAADAPAFAERALRIGEEFEDLALRVAANYYLGTTYFVAGEYRRTDEFFSRIHQLLEGDRFRERCGLAGFPIVMSRFFWVLALAERGDFDHGMSEGREAIRLAEMLDHPYSLVCALRGLGGVYGARGELDDAIRLTERGLASPSVLWRSGRPARLPVYAVRPCSRRLGGARGSLSGHGSHGDVPVADALASAPRRNVPAGEPAGGCPRPDGTWIVVSEGSRPPRLRGLGPSPARRDCVPRRPSRCGGGRGALRRRPDSGLRAWHAPPRRPLPPRPR
jgi:predicted ATPase